MSQQQTKTVLVTGGARGIGRGCAEAFAKAGYKVALHYNSGKDLAAEFVERFPESKAFQANLEDEAQCQSLVKSVLETFGQINVLVNNAGMTIDQNIVFAKPNDFDTLFRVNLKSAFLLTKFVAKSMIKAKSGSIVNMTSVVGHSGNMGQSMYSATKSALTGLTKSSALDLAPFGIRCNAVAPGMIATDMTKGMTEQAQESFLKKIPLGRLGTIDEVAKSVLFLGSDESSYITGTTIHVNGGLYLA